ncbi:MAG: dihydrodipicolinate synthase family protein [Chloroflexota bacterium]|nr:dihydrodipicolinate synthase family protein [Chloroflexota bacterium]
MNKTLPGGLWPVMLTGFNSDGSIDWHSVDELTDWYIASGAAGLFACCLSSEMYELTPEERLSLVQHVVGRSNGRVPVVATGTFGGKLANQAAFVKQMADTGVEAVVAIPNQLVAPDENETLILDRLEHLLVLTDPLPLGLYECPVPHERLIPPETSRQLAATGRFLYLKSISSDPDLTQGKIDAVQGSRLGLYSANTPTALAALQGGAAGVSPISANFYPELFAWLCSAFRDKPEQARYLQRMLTLMESVTSVNYPAAAKYFLQQRGLSIQTKCRVRNIVLSGENMRFIDNLLEVATDLASSLR